MPRLQAGYSSWAKSKRRWTSGWAVRWRWPRPTTCCTAITGESWLPTGATRKATHRRRTSGKKTCPNACPHPPRLGAGQTHQTDVSGRGALAKRISDIRRCWAPKPLRPMCRAMLTHEYTYAYGAVDVCTGELDSLILPHVNTHCMQLFLNEVSARHPDEHIVMGIDGAGWHRSDNLKAPANIYWLQLPPRMRPSSTRWSMYGTSCARSFHNRAGTGTQHLGA